LFDGAQSSDPDGDPLTYSWDFGDGSSEPGATAFHYFVKPGRYVVRLKVSDGKGTACSTAVDEVIVEIKERVGSLKTGRN